MMMLRMLLTLLIKPRVLRRPGEEVISGDSAIAARSRGFFDGLLHLLLDSEVLGGEVRSVLREVARAQGR